MRLRLITRQLENTRTRIDKALGKAASDTMPDLAPQRARLKSYDEWLAIREKLDPPLADSSIHRLPSINAEKASVLTEA